MEFRINTPHIPMPFRIMRSIWCVMCDFNCFKRTLELANVVNAGNAFDFFFRSQFSANLNTISRAGPTARTRAHNTVNCKLGFHIFEIDWCRRQLIAFCKAIIKIIIYSCNCFAQLRLAAIQTGWSMDFEAHTHLWTTRPPANQFRTSRGDSRQWLRCHWTNKLINKIVGIRKSVAAPKPFRQICH